MDPLLQAATLAFLILAAAMLSIELAISVAIFEIALGVVAGSALGMTATPTIEFLAAFGAIVLTFLAGAEVDPGFLRAKLKVSLLVGGLSFLVPFAGAGVFASAVAGWDTPQSLLAGIAMSTTSLAVVYAVLVESGLNRSDVGKVLMSATFITDLCVAVALSVLFIRPSPYVLLFVAVSAGVVVLMLVLQRWFFTRYGGRVIEAEIKGAFAALFLLMWVANLAESHAVLPAFLLGLALARVFQRHPREHRRFRVVAFSLLTPFFFIRGGLAVDLGSLSAALPLVLGFLSVKLALKFVGVMPVALRYLRPHATFTTLLMSTGLTFGTISAIFGLEAGIIDATQFSVLISAVIASAVVPTVIAQRFFSPRLLTAEEADAIEDEEFEPPMRRQ